MECPKHLGYELPEISTMEKCPTCGTEKKVVTGYFCKHDGEEFSLEGESLGIPKPPVVTGEALLSAQEKATLTPAQQTKLIADREAWDKAHPA